MYPMEDGHTVYVTAMKNKKGSNDSAGLHIYCDDRRKTFRSQAKNPIATGDSAWIFARDCEGTEQLRRKRKNMIGDMSSLK